MPSAQAAHRGAKRKISFISFISAGLIDVPARADGFVMCLRDIAQDMTFGEWQDFWLDMGIRIFDAEEEWDEDFTDITDDLEDD